MTSCQLTINHCRALFFKNVCVLWWWPSVPAYFFCAIFCFLLLRGSGVLFPSHICICICGLGRLAMCGGTHERVIVTQLGAVLAVGSNRQLVRIRSIVQSHLPRKAPAKRCRPRPFSVSISFDFPEQIQALGRRSEMGQTLYMMYLVAQRYHSKRAYDHSKKVDTLVE